ncbi:MAG: sigma 54-interacting transcriptional regulator [bacterium]|nr:sigma 54-interacting transcriptional regulator [bacterium]
MSNELLLSLFLVRGTSIVLVLLLVGLALRRSRSDNRQDSPRAFLLLATTTLVWFACPPELLRSWLYSAACLCALAAAWFDWRLPARDFRQRSVRRDYRRTFWTCAGIGLAFALADLLYSIDAAGARTTATTAGAPLQSSGDLVAALFETGATLAPAVLALPVLLYAFTATVNPLMNMRRVLLRILVYVLLIFGAALGLYTCIGLAAVQTSPPLFVLHAIFLAILGCVLGLAFVHLRFLNVTTQTLFFRDAYARERILQEFVGQIQDLGSSRESREVLLEIMLQNLYRALRCERAVVFTLDENRADQSRYLGAPPVGGPDLRRPFARWSGRRLSPEMLARLDRVHPLEAGLPLPELTPTTGRNYPRALESLSRGLDAMREDGYEICFPLVYARRILGFVFLGRKQNARPYFGAERTLLDRARPGYALALHNHSVLSALRARAIANPLPELLAQPDALQEIPLGQDRALLFHESSPMAQVVARTRQTAASTLPVLIQGETGTGKELIARLLHQASPAENAPFVAVNCAAIPATLWESEIFGHRRGAFTGAARDRAGLVAQAGRGVLFFDEIGEMPLDVQPRILRLIQERSYIPVGGRSPERVDCRLIFATHRDLRGMIQNGSFREDLYYRIGVHELKIPPLRERPADLPGMVEHLLARYARLLGQPRREISSTALDKLGRYAWPGNIRELENTLVRILTNLGSTAPDSPITPEDLPPEPRPQMQQPRRPERPTAGAAHAEPKSAKTYAASAAETQIIGAPAPDSGFDHLMRDYATRLIQHTLTRSQGNRTRAAALLKMKRTRLLYQIKELGIDA